MTTDGRLTDRRRPLRRQRRAPLEWKNGCLSYAIDYRGSQWMDYARRRRPPSMPPSRLGRTPNCGGATPNLIFKGALEPADVSTGRIEHHRQREHRCLSRSVPGPVRATRRTRALRICGDDRLAQHEHGRDPRRRHDDQRRVGNWAQFGRRPVRKLPGPLGCPAGDIINPGDADLASIVTHEIGHFIGIGHTEVENATMFASADRTSVEKRTLEQDDIATPSATSTRPTAATWTRRCDATPTGGLELNCETDANRRPHRLRRPRSSLRRAAAAAVAARREPRPTLPGRRFLRHCSGLLGCAGGQLDATHDPELDASVASAVLLRDVGHDRTGRPVAFRHQPGRLHTVLNQPSPNGFGALL